MLRERDDWHVWLLEYGLTHSLLRLAVHPGTYPRHVRVDCMECVRMDANTQGGPYALEVAAVDWHGHPMLEIRSSDHSFRVVCRELRLAGRVE